MNQKTEQFVIRVSPREKEQLRTLSQTQDKSISMVIREGYRHQINENRELLERRK